MPNNDPGTQVTAINNTNLAFVCLHSIGKHRPKSTRKSHLYNIGMVVDIKHKVKTEKKYGHVRYGR